MLPCLNESNRTDVYSIRFAGKNLEKISKIKSRIKVYTAQLKALLLPQQLLEVQVGTCVSQNLFS